MSRLIQIVFSVILVGNELLCRRFGKAKFEVHHQSLVTDIISCVFNMCIISH